LSFEGGGEKREGQEEKGGRRIRKGNEGRRKVERNKESGVGGIKSS